MHYIALLLLVLTFPAQAKETFPKKCTPLSVKGELLTLSAETPSVVMLHNLSNTDLWITHTVAKPSASAGWNTHLAPGHWSALALDKKTFTLGCIESRPGHEQQAACADLLAACQYNSVTAPASKSSTFWAGEDLPLSELIAHLGSRGFKLP